MQAKLKYGLGSFKKLAGIVSSVSLEVNDVHHPQEGCASSKQYLKIEELQSIYKFGNTRKQISELQSSSVLMKH